MYKPCKGTNSEKGVALIMVLGLLTVMVLMAVTFAISMRTERLAAGNAADTLRARGILPFDPGLRPWSFQRRRPDGNSRKSTGR